MDRDEAFKLPFNDGKIKIVAAGFEQPLEDVVISFTDEDGRGVDWLLTKHDVILLARALSVTTNDLYTEEELDVNI